MLLKIVPLYAGILGLLLVALSANVIRFRLRYRIGLGDGERSDVRQAMRVHGNFIEYVPLALILLALLELAKAPPGLLHGLGIALVAGRLGHAYGLSLTSGPSPGRFVGTVATFSVLIVAAVALIGYATGIVTP